MIKKHIPNTITCLNLLSGCFAIVMAFQGAAEMAFLFILLAAVFDFLDGMAARLLKAYSLMGKELDSLADLISFGVAPAAMVFVFLSNNTSDGYLMFGAFIIAVFSALRLAKFNIDERQTTSFIGLPTPANAIFWAGLISMYADFLKDYPYYLIALVVLMSVLLVAEIPLFSLKFKNIKWKGNELPYVFLVGCVVLLCVFVLKSFVWIITWYLLLSLGSMWVCRTKIRKEK